ncbi:MAG: tRNA lysidine(34) synthetase TilS [Rhodospirillales bacterium]
MTKFRTATPIMAEEFAPAMQAFAPFERAPHIAVAVSGGADSTALALLADAWARAHGGTVTALIVDHGLRPEAAAEATQTASKLAARGIRSEILVWRGDKPETGLQAVARQARYALLDDWCRRHGVLHLAVAHHAGDQAETFMMRLRRGSGPDGLAAMAPVRELDACRVLRPVLEFPKVRLEATLTAAGIAWVEDPSNRDPKYARTAIRHELAVTADEQDEIEIATRRFARARRVLETVTADWLARHAALDPAGYLTFTWNAWHAADDEIRLRVLSRTARAIGGKVYAPDLKALERLAAKLEAGQGATLGLARFDAAPDRIGVYREARHLPPPCVLETGVSRWDARFTVSVPAQNAGVTVLPWSATVAGTWPKRERPAWYAALPAKVRAGLPVFHVDGGYFVRNPGDPKNVGISIRFAPQMPLSGSGFSVA